MQSEALLLFGKGTSACGAPSVKPTTGAPRVRILNSTATGFEVDLRLPTPAFDGATFGQRSFVSLAQRGLGEAAAAGAPATPASAHLFAIPNGAQVSFKTDASSSIVMRGVDLAPAQPAQLEQDPEQFRFDAPQFAERPLKIDEAAYKSRRPFPARAVQPVVVGDVRGLNLAMINAAGAQYIPQTKALKVFTSMRLKVTFAGGTGKFADQRFAAANDSPIARTLSRLVVNAGAVFSNLANIPNFEPCGDELMIITTQSLLPQAQRLAAAREAQGIETGVFTVGAVDIGSTPESIRNFIQAKVKSTTCSVRPSDVILFGDSAGIPPWVQTGEAEGGSIATDFPYSQSSLSFFLPNISLGRLPVETVAEATTVVDKLLAYPIAPGDFTNRATVAGFFQYNGESGPQRESRTFVEDTHLSRAALQGIGKTVDRYYTKQEGSNPKKFNDGTNLPSDLQLPTFPWNDTGDEIKAAFNAGRSLVLHRDHAGPGGWGDPSFGISQVNTLTNGNALPLVLSINCSSGRFDNPGPSFAEALLRRNGGGAFAVIAASRDTWTLTNSPFSRGLIHGLTGRIAPFVGTYPVASPIRNLGELLLYGRVILLLQRPDHATYVRDIFRSFHLFGDPTMSVRL